LVVSLVSSTHRPRPFAVGLTMTAVLSVQTGSALATHLFATAGPGGASFLRLAFGAIILLAVWRPSLRDHGRSALLTALLFGIAVAAMNFAFYAAIDRIPLGIAVTLEFAGPLSVAVAGSHRPLDLVWVLLAAAGVALLAPWGGLHLQTAGVLLGLLAGAFWACYIILSARLGRVFTGGQGLSIALTVGALCLAPVGVVSAATHLLDPRVLIVGVGVGVLSSVIPYSAEMEALRSLPTRTFGVLMSTEPAVGAMVGLVFLGQVLSARAVLAMLFVMVAAAAPPVSGAAGDAVPLE
jgi:inner membrane transporter RhtA